ncbi:glycosyltransferase family 4 protein [Sulfuriferula thiophila]|uniref:glycosyltransferase family 4 protein n=1 Tax=Sulfuriferula thiophila TaxID=1781211 RepID=UPI000F60E8C2|nr:glycosyltransferase family 1 protein [Sulfuriferula thiophila]
MNDELLLQTFIPRPQPLRIALVTETYPPEINGVAMTLGRQVIDLQSRGHQVQLIRPKQGVADKATHNAQLEEVLKMGVPIPRYAGLKMGLPAKAALVRLWQLKRPDLVHIATEGPLGWSALAAAHKLRLPVSTDFHTNFHSYSKHYGAGWLRRPILAYLRKFHNKACVTLVPTEGMRKELQTHGYRNLEVVSRGVDTMMFTPVRRDETLRASWGVKPDTQVVIYVGRIAPEKNLPLVFEAYAAMHAINPNSRLVIVGDGPERAALQAQNPDAIFCGMRSGEDLARHYAAGDVFLFPSLTETFGNVTTEAMASGLAVVAYQYAAAEALIRHGENGMVAPYNDAKKYIEAAVELAREPARAKQIGGRAHQTALSISWDSIHDRFERVLHAIIDKEDCHGEIELAVDG